MKDKSNRKVGVQAGLPRGIVKLYTDGEPAYTKSKVNVWLLDSLFEGSPGYVFIDKVMVFYSYN